MKYLNLLLVICLGLSSCKKNHTCECISKDMNSATVASQTFIIKEKNKSSALQTCKENHSTSFPEITITCSLK